MLRTKNILILMAVFVMGFGVSEYRQQKVLPALSVLGEGESHSLTSYPSMVSQTLASQSTITATAESAVQLETLQSIKPTVVNAAEIQGASWAEIDQLIAKGNYDTAIRLAESRMSNNKESAHAWLLLAYIYQKQLQVRAAVDAMFRYIKLEENNQEIEKVLTLLQKYLLQLKATPALFNEDYGWLMAQYSELLKYRSNDGDLRLDMATLSLALNDAYQAEYHALIALNDPHVKGKAVELLAKIKESGNRQEIEVPLIRYGHQYLVNAIIEGNSARLLIDTGASVSGLTTTYIAQYPSLLKATKPMRVLTAGGVRDSLEFSVNTINLGNVVFNQFRLVQLPMEKTTEFDGLLGLDILKRFDFVIDQNAAVLRLKPRK